jgi:hypothetical protein
VLACRRRGRLGSALRFRRGTGEIAEQGLRRLGLRERLAELADAASGSDRLRSADVR